MTDRVPERISGGRAVYRGREARERAHQEEANLIAPWERRGQPYWTKTREPPEGGNPEGRRVRLAPVAAIPVATILIFPLVLIRLVAADETAGARAKQGVVPDKMASHSADCCPLQTPRGLCGSQPSGQGEGESSRNQN
jgi:hypothetical protein